MSERLSPQREAEIGSKEWLEGLPFEERLAIVEVFAMYRNDAVPSPCEHKGCVEHLRWLLAELAAVRAERDEARRMLDGTARLAGRLENRVNRASAERDEVRTALREACDQVAERDDEIGKLSATCGQLRVELAGRLLAEEATS